MNVLHGTTFDNCLMVDPPDRPDVGNQRLRGRACRPDLTTLATTMGLHIRIGTEDTQGTHPNSDEQLKDNLEMFDMARDIAGLLGRKPATANEYRAMLCIPSR